MNYTPETTNTQLIQKVSTIPLINNTIYKLNPATQNIFNSIIQSKKKIIMKKNIKFNNVIHNNNKLQNSEQYIEGH